MTDNERTDLLRCEMRSPEGVRKAEELEAVRLVLFRRAASAPRLAREATMSWVRLPRRDADDIVHPV